MSFWENNYRELQEPIMESLVTQVLQQVLPTVYHLCVTHQWSDLGLDIQSAVTVLPKRSQSCQCLKYEYSWNMTHLSSLLKKGQ